jgi:hypothetical protein
MDCRGGSHVVCTQKTMQVDACMHAACIALQEPIIRGVMAAGQIVSGLPEHVTTRDVGTCVAHAWVACQDKQAHAHSHHRCSLCPKLLHAQQMRINVSVSYCFTAVVLELLNEDQN